MAMSSLMNGSKVLRQFSCVCHFMSSKLYYIWKTRNTAEPAEPAAMPPEAQEPKAEAHKKNNE